MSDRRLRAAVKLLQAALCCTVAWRPPWTTCWCWPTACGTATTSAFVLATVLEVAVSVLQKARKLADAAREAHDSVQDWRDTIVQAQLGIIKRVEGELADLDDDDDVQALRAEVLQLRETVARRFAEAGGLLPERRAPQGAARSPAGRHRYGVRPVRFLGDVLRSHPCQATRDAVSLLEQHRSPPWHSPPATTPPATPTPRTA